MRVPHPAAPRLLARCRTVTSVLVTGLLVSALVPFASGSAQTRLLRQPTISASHIAFAYANNIWVTAIDGGDARRLTSFQGTTSLPKLSPDGSQVAFSGEYGGNTDVYVVAVGGGEPTRLTWHPGADLVQGWSTDGARIVFSSSREAFANAPKFWSVSVRGDLPTALPMPRAWQGKYSPDGQRFAYRMANSWDDEWRNYRGGQNRAIWIMNLASYTIESPPWTDSKDIDPVWVGDVVYFISDRDWCANVWSYDTRSKALKQVTRFTDLDVKSLDAGGGQVVFEQAGYLHKLDPATGQHRRLNITARGDFPWLVPQWKDVSNRMTNIALSPTGKRVVVEARGEVFTIPTEKGDWRNLTRTSGVAERTPSWSPDGATVAYFSDESGEYQLFLQAADGLSPPRRLSLPDPSFYYTPAWSPDGSKLMYTDTHLNLWVLDVASGQTRKIDTDGYMVPERSLNPVWSPDSRWVAYAKRLPTQLHAIYVHHLESRATRQITDGLSDATWPAWDASGKYLYFLGSTDFALRTGWLDMTAYDHAVTRAIYLAVLTKDEPSPLPPESDEDSGITRVSAPSADSAPARNGTASTRTVPPVRIDFDGLSQRILSLGITARDYSALQSGPAGTIFFTEAVAASGTSGGNSGGVLHRYQLKERKATAFAQNVQEYVLSQDRKKLLWRSGATLTLADTDKPAPTGTAGRVTATLRMQVDPRAEYRQMFTEGWRNQREYLYVPNMHGADYVKTKALYEPMLEHVAHRADFNYLLDMLGAEIAIGHSYVRGGDYPDVPNSNVGLLGADWRVIEGRYRIARIFTGESWNPELRAPLSGPGIDVREGDYLLAVDGVNITSTDNLFRVFEGTANRQVVLTLNGTPTATGARRVTVVPLANESGLRSRAWIEGNRRIVDSLSGGKLAYVYVPNTGQPGYTSFNRYYFAQQDRAGVIIDERYNGGGSAADYMIEVMQRDFDGYFNNPVHERTPFTSPTAGIWGPKVMIINEMAGSGGDLLPYMFKRRKIGTLVGKRTWGGLVGTWDTPTLIDGGTMIAPRGGFFDRDGKWAVENEGVAPDIDVEYTPREVIAGHDPQLERAVAEAMRQLRENPVELKAEPPAPVRSRRPDPR